jgi:hypothetical protein
MGFSLRERQVDGAMKPILSYVMGLPELERA